MLTAFDVRCAGRLPGERFSLRAATIGASVVFQLDLWRDPVAALYRRSCCLALRSLEAFLREAPIVLSRAAPVLPVPRDAGELDALVGMQQLQLTFVYSRVLGKKTRVRQPGRHPEALSVPAPRT